MKICQNCGAEVSDTAKFCRKCGAKMEPVPAKKEEASESAETQGFQEESFQSETFQSRAHRDDGLREEAYEWGPPTGGENYDEQAMPAVLVGDAEKETKAESNSDDQSADTYRLNAPSYDHTYEFDPKDISDNKVMAMAAYLLGPLGVIIALLAGKDSPYADFHMRQALKFVVVEALIVIVSTLLCWTLVVPAAALIFGFILEIVKVITFISVCRGKAIEPAIIRSIGFLK